MMSTHRLLGCLFAGWVCANAAHAADPPERAQLRAQRQAIEADYAAREQACLKQFVVTPCVEKVRLEKMDALEGIRQRENALEDAARLKRAQAQEQRLADKAAERAAVAASGPTDDATSTPRRPPKSSKVGKNSAEQGLHLPKTKPAPPADERAAEEQRKRAEFEDRQREIKAHREAIERRNAERAARKKTPPAPLPVPPEVSSSAAR